ncbi:hypothetical protein ACFPAF_09815 [Hymenobacter endophyticus]|uniref:CBM-cenC domain-containing protein n=1 Tax=Hymenobacter endophyticus TaxID=3076335 RepID=A0ABU3TH63_9BACT|nr:hypothetical protein [Hymenobacter endophyticus]MDU0370688.1 hypothetical protein [Hymenobacter endophyticus]
MTRFAPVLLLTGLLAACTPGPAPAAADATLAFNDFENVSGWLIGSPYEATLSRDKAHSGKFSCRVDAEHEYSLGYKNTLSQLASDYPPKLTIGAWVFVPNAQAKAKLVTEIKSPDQPGSGQLWEGVDLSTAVSVFNKWQYVEQTITVPATAGPQSTLQVYVWRDQTKVPVYVDDMRISLAK